MSFLSAFFIHQPLLQGPWFNSHLLSGQFVNSLAHYPSTVLPHPRQTLPLDQSNSLPPPLLELPTHAASPSFPRAQPTMMSALLPSFHEDQDCSPLITNDPMSLNPTDVSSPS